MKDVLNDFKSCGRPMTKNEIKIKQLEEDLEAEKSISSNLARRILKAIKYLKLKVDIPKNHLEEAIRDIEEDLLKILEGEENE
jgi:hypothetical protein